MHTIIPGLLCISACTGGTYQRASPTADSVVSAALVGFLSPEVSTLQSVYLNRLLRFDGLPDDALAWLRDSRWASQPPHVQELAAAFWIANQRPARLAASPAIPGLAVTLTSRTIDPDARDGPWFAYASRPGFNLAGDTALMWVSLMCGRRCGGFEWVTVAMGPHGWHRARVLIIGLY